MGVKIFNQREFFYQYDTKQKLIVEDEEVNELHFTNGSLENAYTIKCYEEDNIKLCDIPNSFLEKSGILTVYAYCVVNGEYTKKAYMFRVIERKKPDDYVAEEDAPRWSQLEKQVDELRNDIEHFEVSEEMIESSVDAYLKKNPIDFEVPEEYITEEELEQRGYITLDEVPECEVDEETLNQINKNTEEISKLSSEIDGKQPKGDYASASHTHDEYLTEHQDLSSYALKSELPTDYASKDHTHTNYATKEDLNNVSVSEEQIEEVVSNYLEENPIEGAGGIGVEYDEEQKAIIFSGSSGGNGGASAWKLIDTFTLSSDTLSYQFDISNYDELMINSVSGCDYSGCNAYVGDKLLLSTVNGLKNSNHALFVKVLKNLGVWINSTRGSDTLSNSGFVSCTDTSTLTLSFSSISKSGTINVYGR